MILLQPRLVAVEEHRRRNHEVEEGRQGQKRHHAKANVYLQQHNTVGREVKSRRAGWVIHGGWEKNLVIEQSQHIPQTCSLNQVQKAGDYVVTA